MLGRNAWWLGTVLMLTHGQAEVTIETLKCFCMIVTDGELLSVPVASGNRAFPLV